MVWYLSVEIEGGEVDHVRASYSDKPAVEVLEKLFPKAYWTGENPDAIETPLEFDFVRNSSLAGNLVAAFLEQARGNPGREAWAREFMKTYEVGEKLQKLGLHPRVSIG